MPRRAKERIGPSDFRRRKAMLTTARLLCVIGLLQVSWSSVRIKTRAQFKTQGTEAASLGGTGGFLVITKAEPPAICSRLPWSDKLVVAARYDEDVSWMAAYLAPWLPFLVYSTSRDHAATHRTASNTGREAHAYLQFIVDYYECLPHEVAFVHAHRSSPHSPDMLQELQRLRWGALPGYVSLSRPVQLSTFYLANPEHHLPKTEVDPESANWMQFAHKQSLQLRRLWPTVFEPELGPMPDEVTPPCCAQFAVPAARILKHPKSFYQDSLRWLQTTDTDAFWAGLPFEHTWPYIFGASLNYTHPDECDAFTCDAHGAAATPPWEAVMSRRPGC